MASVSGAVKWEALAGRIQIRTRLSKGAFDFPLETLLADAAGKSSV